MTKEPSFCDILSNQLMKKLHKTEPEAAEACKIYKKEYEMIKNKKVTTWHDYKKMFSDFAKISDEEFHNLLTEAKKQKGTLKSLVADIKNLSIQDKVGVAKGKSLAERKGYI